MPSAYFCTLSRLFRVTEKLVLHRRSINEVLALAAIFFLNLRCVRRNILYSYRLGLQCGDSPVRFS